MKRVEEESMKVGLSWDDTLLQLKWIFDVNQIESYIYIYCSMDCLHESDCS